jgi:hypothetical protein
MDLPLNTYRQALFRSKTYFPDHILIQAFNLMMKIDMAFTDPSYPLFPANPPPPVDVFDFPLPAPPQPFNPSIDPDDIPDHDDPVFQFDSLPAHGASTTPAFRQALLGENSFSPLWRVLHNWSPWEGLIRSRDWHEHQYSDPRPLSRLDVLKLYACHKLPNADLAPFLDPSPPLDLPPRRVRFMGVPLSTIRAKRFERSGLQAWDSSVTAYDADRRPRQREGQDNLSFLRGPRVFSHGRELVPLLLLDELILGELLRRRIQLGWLVWKALGEGYCPTLRRPPPGR